MVQLHFIFIGSALINKVARLVYEKNVVDRDYSKAYVRHLFVAKEYLAKQIASIHNLAFYLDLVKVAREHIVAGDFYEWKDSIIPQLKQRL